MQEDLAHHRRLALDRSDLLHGLHLQDKKRRDVLRLHRINNVKRDESRLCLRTGRRSRSVLQGNVVYKWLLLRNEKGAALFSYRSAETKGPMPSSPPGSPSDSSIGGSHSGSESGSQSDMTSKTSSVSAKRRHATQSQGSLS